MLRDMPGVTVVPPTSQGQCRLTCGHSLPPNLCALGCATQPLQSIRLAHDVTAGRLCRPGSWSRACRDQDPPVLLPQLPEDERRVERGHRGLPALVLVAVGQTAPVDRLLHGVAGQNPV